MRRSPWLLPVPALVVLACNAILGNETGAYVEPDAAGASSSSSSGAAASSSSGNLPADGGSSSSSSSSGATVDASACAAGRLDEQHPALCNPEDLPILGTPAVTGLAATGSALYVARPGSVERYPFDGDPTTAFSLATDAIGAALPTGGTDPDTLYWLADQRVHAATGGFQELDAGWPSTYLAKQLAPIVHGVVAFATVQPAGQSLVTVFDDGRPGNEPFIASTSAHLFLGANADGIYWGSPEPLALEIPELHLMRYNGQPTQFELSADAGQVSAVAASATTAYVAGCCPQPGICRLQGTAATAGTAPVIALPDASKVTAMFAADSVLLWSEFAGSIETTSVCDATNCAASKHLLGAGALLATALTTEYMYFALSAHGVQRMQRVR